MAVALVAAHGHSWTSAFGLMGPVLAERQGGIVTATETDALISLISRCAQSCEGCGGHVSGVMPDRRLLIYCKDAAQKCSDLAEAMRTDASHASEKLAECYHSVERAASMLELQIFDFCRECAKLCRETAQACKLLAQDRNIVLT